MTGEVIKATEVDTLDQIVARVAEKMRPAVEAIEAQPVATTRHHYGDYMGILLQFADDRGQRAILARALIKAGANEQGVNDALKVSV